MKALAGGASGWALAVLMRGRVVAADGVCRELCSQPVFEGSLRAVCRRACRECGADFNRICEPTKARLVCCPNGEVCCQDCRVGGERCWILDPVSDDCFLVTV